MIKTLSGTWYNQHGSELVLEVAEDGKINGTFKSNAGLAAGAEASAVVGFASDDLVVFSANFGKYDSLTAWTGHHVTQGEEALHMMWHMTVTVRSPHPERDLWKGVWTGSDVFLRERAVAARRDHLPSHPIAEWP